MKEKRFSRLSPEYQKKTQAKASKSTKVNRATRRKTGKSVDPIKSTKIPHLEEPQRVSIANLISQSQQMQFPFAKRSPASCDNVNSELNNERMAFSLSSSRSERIEPILPERSQQFLNKKTLILDLDETLVHSGFKPFNPSDIILSIELEKQMHNIHVLVRPGVEQFISRMAKRFEIIVFTASLSKYADPLLNILDKEKVCQHRLFRENCTIVNGAFIKDLKRLGRNMKNVILVDNSPVAYALHPENGFPIKSWYDDKNDKELFNLAPLIEFLSYVPDVREFIPKMVVNNEISFQLSMELIKNYNSQLRNHQIQVQQHYQNKLFANMNSENANEECNWPNQKSSHLNKENSSNSSKGINIKIVNNNYTNYIYNNSNNTPKALNEDNTEEAKPNKKRNNFRNSHSGTNLHITSSSSAKQMKSNITQDNCSGMSCQNNRSLQKDTKKKYMIRLSTAKDSPINTNAKSIIPIPSHKKSNRKKINITTNGLKTKGNAFTSTNTTTNGVIDTNLMNRQIHKRQRSFSKERSQSKGKKLYSTKHSRSNSSQQSRLIGFKPETFSSVDRIAFPYEAFNRKPSQKNQKPVKRTKSSDKLEHIPRNHPSLRNNHHDNNSLKHYSTNVSSCRPSTKFKNIDMKKQYDSDMNPLMSQGLLYY